MNVNHMSMMKISLIVIPMCPRERFALYNSSSRLVLCYKKDWATLLHLSYSCYLLPVTNYLITKLSVTDNFSACTEYLAENCLSGCIPHIYMLRTHHNVVYADFVGNQEKIQSAKIRF